MSILSSSNPGYTGSRIVRRPFATREWSKRPRNRRRPPKRQAAAPDHVLYIPFWTPLEYSHGISELTDCMMLTPTASIINQRQDDCNILTNYLVPFYLVDHEYYPNIQPTASLQAFKGHYPRQTDAYKIYLHKEFLHRRKLREANNIRGILSTVDESVDGDALFEWHVSVAQEILSWFFIPNWCCICCDQNAAGIYRAAQRFRIDALVNLLEETPYGPILKSGHDQTWLKPPVTDDGMPLHSLVVPMETEFNRPTCFFWSTNLDYRDLRRLRRGMHLVDKTFFALEVLDELPFTQPLGRLSSSANDVHDGEVDLSKRFLDSRGEVLSIYTPSDVQKLGITMWSFLNCITRITRNAHSLNQPGNQVIPFLPLGPQEGSSFSMQILDPLKKWVEEAARSVELELEQSDDLFSFSFAGNKRPCYFFDRYENRPHILVTGSARTLELFLRKYSFVVGDINLVIAALCISNPSPEIYHAVVKSVKVVGYNSLVQSLYIVEERVLDMLNLLSVFQNQLPVSELHSILEIKEITSLV